MSDIFWDISRENDGTYFPEKRQRFPGEGHAEGLLNDKLVYEESGPNVAGERVASDRKL